MISVSLPDVQLLTMPLPWQLYGGTNPLAPVAWFRTAHLRDVDGVEMAEMPTLSLQPECRMRTNCGTGARFAASGGAEIPHAESACSPEAVSRLDERSRCILKVPPV